MKRRDASSKPKSTRRLNDYRKSTAARRSRCVNSGHHPHTLSLALILNGSSVHHSHNDRFNHRVRISLPVLERDRVRISMPLRRMDGTRRCSFSQYSSRSRCGHSRQAHGRRPCSRRKAAFLDFERLLMIRTSCTRSGVPCFRYPFSIHFPLAFAPGVWRFDL